MIKIDTFLRKIGIIACKVVILVLSLGRWNMFKIVFIIKLGSILEKGE